MGVIDSFEGAVYHYDKSMERLDDGELRGAVESATEGFRHLKHMDGDVNNEVRARTETAVSYIRDGKRLKASEQLREVRVRVQEKQAENLNTRLSGMR